MKLNLDSTPSLHDDFKAAFERVLRGAALIRGPEYSAFCEEFAAYHSPAHMCIGTASGLDALYIMLKAFGIGAGDEVITPTHNVAFTALAIARTGATPIFADCTPDTMLLDPAAAAAAITPRTAAILPVHLYGQCAPMRELNQLAERHGLLLIEDAAQAHGATHYGQLAGTLGDATAFSFYPTKPLGALGDGGAILLRDPAIAAKCARLADGGRSDRYLHSELAGINSGLDELHAALLRIKLRHLDAMNVKRRHVAASYDVRVSGHPVVADGNTHIYHLYVMTHDRRDELMTHLDACNIPSLIHYPCPVHLQPCFGYLNGRTGQFPVTEALAGRILSLPCHAGLTLTDIDHVLYALDTFD